MLTDHLINLTTKVIGSLEFYPENIRRNLDLLNGLNMAESVMIVLAEHVGRQEAHSITRECSIAAYGSGRSLKDVLLKRKDVTAHIGTAVEQVDAVVARLRTRV